MNTSITEAVKAHARANYGIKGWDIVVEAYSDSELAAEIGDASTAEEAIAKVGAVVGTIRDYEDDIRAEGGSGW